jgi:tRNA (cytidine/uridine-2'-O-)-methyltransferase
MTVTQKFGVVFHGESANQDLQFIMKNQTNKLRAKALKTPFRIVLIEPEIPPNTGNVARLCAATSSPLHLVGKLGFRIDSRSVRRAGLDYWHLVDLHRHDDLAAFRREFPEARLRLFSANVSRSYLELDLQPGDALVFGRESVGLPRELVEAHPDASAAIPTLGQVRSLNIANAAAIVLYDGLRRCGALGDTFTDVG